MTMAALGILPEFHSRRLQQESLINLNQNTEWQRTKEWGWRRRGREGAENNVSHTRNSIFGHGMTIMSSLRCIYQSIGKNSQLLSYSANFAFLSAHGMNICDCPLYNIVISILSTPTLTYRLITYILYNLQDSKYEMTESPASSALHNYTVTL